MQMKNSRLIMREGRKCKLARKGGQRRNRLTVVAFTSWPGKKIEMSLALAHSPDEEEEEDVVVGRRGRTRMERKKRETSLSRRLFSSFSLCSPCESGQKERTAVIIGQISLSS